MNIFGTGPTLIVTCTMGYLYLKEAGLYMNIFGTGPTLIVTCTMGLTIFKRGRQVHEHIWYRPDYYCSTCTMELNIFKRGRPVHEHIWYRSDSYCNSFFRSFQYLNLSKYIFFKNINISIKNLKNLRKYRNVHLSHLLLI